MKLLFGTTHGPYIIELKHDGVSYHYYLRLRWQIIHHFVAEFDSETLARKWASETAVQHIEAIENGTL